MVSKSERERFTDVTNSFLVVLSAYCQIVFYCFQLSVDYECILEIKSLDAFLFT